MHIVYKYQLSPVTVLDLPWGAQILTARLQGDQMVLWAFIDQQEPRTVRRQFICINTGVSVDLSRAAYISTVETASGIVWHIFEVQP